jgi:protease I
MDKASLQHLLGGLSVAILADSGFEEVELTAPVEALEQLGVNTQLISVSLGQIQGFHHDKPGDMFHVDMALQDAQADAFDAVFLPGGVRNADMLRTSRHAQEFVREIDRQGKPLGVICHGPWLLVSAGLVRGRKLTSWPSLEADIPAFNAAFKELLASRTQKSVAGAADEADTAAGTGG